MNEDNSHILLENEIDFLEEEEKDDEPFASIRDFYRLPEGYVQDVTPDPLPVFNQVVPEVKSDTEETQEPLRKVVKRRRVDLNVTASLQRLSSLELLGWLGHLLFLNRFADDQIIQGMIYSLYCEGPLYTDAFRIYLFIQKNFDVYRPSSTSWPLPVPIDHVTIKLFRYYLYRVIRRRRGSFLMVNIIYVALCRSLGVYARLVLAFPPSGIKMNATNCDDPKLCLVHPASDTLIKKLMNRSSESPRVDARPLSERSRRHCTSQIMKAKLKPIKNLHGRLECKAEIWSEVFWKQKKRWVAVNLEKKLFDYKNPEKSKQNLVSLRDCDTEILKISKVTPAKNNVLYNNVESNNDFNQLYPWEGDDETSEMHMDETEVLSAKEEAANMSPVMKFSGLLMTNTLDSDDQEDDAQIELVKNEDCSISTTTTFYRGVNGDDSKATNTMSGVCILDPTVVPLSPENSFDQTIEASILAHDVSSAFNTKRKFRPEIPSSSSVSAPPLLTLSKPGVCTTTEDKSSHHHASQTTPLKVSVFIIAANQHSLLRDVSRRYHSRLNGPPVHSWSDVVTARGRNHQFLCSALNYWNASLETNIQTVITLDELDEFALQEFVEREPIPTSKSKFKKHPKYCLESMILDTEIIVPKEPILGFFQGEPIYSRRNVRSLFTRNQWSERYNRIVRFNETPSRQLKTIRRKKGSESVVALIDLFAEWQTDLAPRAAARSSGRIPCTDYGNVNLIGAREPPNGCVHLSGLPGITYIVRRMETIEWKPALVGFDFNKSNKPTPKIDGIVVLDKDRDAVLSEWKKYFQRKLNISYIKQQQKTQDLWRSLFKSLLGRYYRALESQPTNEVTFADAREAISKQLHDHISTKKSQNLDDDDVDEI